MPTRFGVLGVWGLTRPPCDLNPVSTTSHTGLTPGSVCASSATGAQPATLHFLPASIRRAVAHSVVNPYMQHNKYYREIGNSNALFSPTLPPGKAPEHPLMWTLDAVAIA